MRTRTNLRALIGFAALFATSTALAQQETAQLAEGKMRIRIVVEGDELQASLVDSVGSRDFAALLPLDLTLADYHATEKIADLPSRLSTVGAPEGVDPEAGDIAYFAPWGNLALFYRDFGCSRGLIRLGRIEGSVAALERDAPLTVRIERVEE